jgi:NADPH:quinone reductase-like Zn-dependent oxidoreductase
VRTARFEDEVKNIDVVIDTVGGDTLDRSLEVLKPGGVLVSAVATPDQDKAARYHVRGVWFLVTVTSYGLAKIADLIDSGQLSVNVGCREKNPLKDTYERDRDTLVTDTI